MNLKEIQDQVQRLKETFSGVSKFLVNDLKHIQYFVENVEKVLYVWYDSEAINVGVNLKEEEEPAEARIKWEDFLTYLYKVHCGY